MSHTAPLRILLLNHKELFYCMTTSTYLACSFCRRSNCCLIAVVSFYNQDRNIFFIPCQLCHGWEVWNEYRRIFVWLVYNLTDVLFWHHLKRLTSFWIIRWTVAQFCGKYTIILTRTLLVIDSSSSLFLEKKEIGKPSVTGVIEV